MTRDVVDQLQVPTITCPSENGFVAARQEIETLRAALRSRPGEAEQTEAGAAG